MEDKVKFKIKINVKVTKYFMDKYISGINNLPPGISNVVKRMLIQQDPVNIATGIAMGAAFTTLITSLVENTIVPSTHLLLGIIKNGKNAFGAAPKSFGTEVGGFMSYTLRGVEFKIGKVIQAFLIFLCILLILQYGVIGPINNLKNKLGLGLKSKAPCPFCMTQINQESTRCQACTSQLTTGWAENKS